MSDPASDIVEILRTLQSEPNTILIGFSPVTTFSRAFREEYVQKTIAGDPGHPVTGVEMPFIPVDEIMLCVPDDPNEPLHFYRVRQGDDAA